MNLIHPVLIASLVLGGQIAATPDTSRYRAYVLESSVASVLAATGGRPSDVTTLHERPALIQELLWRAPYVSAMDTPADPVRDIAFRFHDNALYSIVVTYHRDRTEGLTNADVIAGLSTTYGEPVIVAARTRLVLPTEALPDSVVLARWENGDSLLTLVRKSYSPEFQLILISKPLSARATGAIREAAKLDAIDAPRRESAQRKKDADDASAALDKTRSTNKAAFRP
jgi:hypothetical protein